MRNSSAPLRIQVIVLCVLAFCGTATMNRPASADEVLARKTAPGREVLVRGFAEFDGDCRLKHVQTIRVTEAPAHGRVEQRPGVVTIGDNWVGSKACTGTKLDGVQVFYIPEEGYVGADRFAIDVEYLSHRTVHAKVDVTVAR